MIGRNELCPYKNATSKLLFAVGAQFIAPSHPK